MNCTDTFFQTLHYLESSAPKYSYPLKKKFCTLCDLINIEYIYSDFKYLLRVFTSPDFEIWQGLKIQQVIMITHTTHHLR